jgi:ketosteroid isomerase-like protein
MVTQATDQHGSTRIDHDKETLADIRRAVEQAENAGDAEYIAGLFGEEAVLMVPDFPVQEGRTACADFIRGLLPGLLSAFDRRVTYTSAEVSVLAEIAVDRGSFSFIVRPKAGGATECVTGKYLWLYTRNAGDAWKWSRVMMSRDEREDLTESDRHSASNPLSANLALPFAILLALAEIVRNWGAWGFWPFWVVDYIAVALLLIAWYTSTRGRARAPVMLAGAWGFTCAMFYMSFFLHLAETGASDTGPIAHHTVTLIVGLLFAVTVIGFISSLVNMRRR